MPRHSGTGHRGWTSTWRKPSGRWAPSGCGSGASTSARPGTASRPDRTPSTSCCAAGRSPRGPAPSPPAPATSRRAGEFPRSASRPECPVERAGPHRLLGLELPTTGAAVIYPEGLPATALAGALRGALRHGRGQRDLLPAALARARVEAWAEQTPRRFVFAVKASRYLTHVKRLKAIGPGAKRFLRAARSRWPRRASWARCCGSCPENFQRDDDRLAETLEASAPGSPLLRVPSPELVHRRRSMPCSRRHRCRAGDRRPPRAPVPDPRDHRGLDLRSLPLRAAAGGAATTPSASWRSGSAGSLPGARELEVFALLQQRLGGLRPPRRPLAGRSAFIRA